jgi:hypothetical protein
MGWDDEPRRPGRDPRMGAPGASSRRNPAPQSPFDPYQPYGSTRVPTPGASGRWAADQMGFTSAQMTAVSQHHGFSLFHDGNAGHLWRGEVASLLGEAVLTTGLLMWLVTLTQSPYAVGLALVLLGVPWLLAGPLAAPLTRVAEPGRGLAWIGRLRFLLALGFIPMHFTTIYPVVFALIFAIALLGRLREALRVAAFRTCLAPGEPERVSSDLYIGGAVVAVCGPLLATLTFALVGERVLLVAVFAAICYLVASNSDGFLDALPESKRAFLNVQPDDDERAALLEDGDEDDERLDDPRMVRELALPEWYQIAPSTFWQAIGELRAGMGLAGGSPISQTALLALCTLSLVGGGLAALEVFLVQNRLGLPTLYLGPLLAAEAAGLALGALAGSGFAARGHGRPAVIVGVIGSGVALAALPVVPLLLAVLVCALLLGFFNAIAVAGARSGLAAGFTGVERRAISAAETWLVALSGAVGAGLFAIFYAGVDGIPQLPASLAHLPFHGWSVGVIISGSGVCLVASAVIFLVLEARKQRRARPSSRSVVGDDYDESFDGYDGESAYLPAADGWDDQQGGGWGDDDYGDDPSVYGPAQGGFSAGGASRSSNRAPTRRGGLLNGRGQRDDDGSAGSRFRR